MSKEEAEGSEKVEVKDLEPPSFTIVKVETLGQNLNHGYLLNVN